MSFLNIFYEGCWIINSTGTLSQKSRALSFCHSVYTTIYSSPICVRNCIHAITSITVNVQLKEGRLMLLYVKMVGKRSVLWLQIRSYIFARLKIGQSAKNERVKKEKTVASTLHKFNKKEVCWLRHRWWNLGTLFKPKQKSANRVWPTKHARRPVIAKRTITVKKVLYCICVTNNRPAIQILVIKVKHVTAKFY